MQVIVPFTQAIVVYWMLGLHNTAERFFLFVLALVLVTLCSTALGIMVSCFVPNANVGIVIAPVLMILFLLVSGFLINEGDIPEYYVINPPPPSPPLPRRADAPPPSPLPF
jgi:ABC-type multidrug transport system permease subunit